MNIQEQVELLPFNTFKISAKAKYFVSIDSIPAFQELVRHPIFKRERHFILGGGSNILLTRDFDGLIIKVDLKGIEITAQDDDTVTLKAGSGEVWHDLVMHCVANNWGGIENLSLIPGTVGAAPMQNIGAYGVEIRDVIESVEAIDRLTGDIRVFTPADCDFGYRESVFKQEFKEKYFISSVTLRLTKKNHRLNTSYGAIEQVLQQHNTPVSIRAISDAVISIRQQKLPNPIDIGNAGSFFKNPTINEKAYHNLKKSFPELPGYILENQYVKVPAAWLIENCGWKGKTFGKIGVHAHQALVLVNYGGGTGEEIWELAQRIIASVKEKFNIVLQPEVNVVR